MDELDLFRTFRRGVAAPSADAQRRASARLTSALEEAIGREQGAHLRHGGRRRRFVVLAAAAIVVVVATASAFGTVRSFIEGEPSFRVVAVIPCKGKRGSFEVQLQFESPRSWKIGRGTGQYVRITGGGRIPSVGGKTRSWSARLVGVIKLPGSAEQRVAITLTRRPEGVFVLTPLESGALRRDSGTHARGSWYG